MFSLALAKKLRILSFLLFFWYYQEFQSRCQKQLCKSSIIRMTWSKKSSLIIHPSIHHKNRNPDNQGIILKMECFINPGIARITVIEVPVFEVSLYNFNFLILRWFYFLQCQKCRWHHNSVANWSIWSIYPRPCSSRIYYFENKEIEKERDNETIISENSQFFACYLSK